MFIRVQGIHVDFHNPVNPAERHTDGVAATLFAIHVATQIQRRRKYFTAAIIHVFANYVNSARRREIENYLAVIKGKFSIEGFRKGKAPRAMIEKMYGPEIFFEEAADLDDDEF